VTQPKIMGHLVLPTRWRALRCFWPDPGIRERQLLGPQRERTGRADDEEPVCSVRRSYHPASAAASAGGSP